MEWIWGILIGRKKVNVFIYKNCFRSQKGRMRTGTKEVNNPNDNENCFPSLDLLLTNPKHSAVLSRRDHNPSDHDCSRHKTDFVERMDCIPLVLDKKIEGGVDRWCDNFVRSSETDWQKVVIWVIEARDNLQRKEGWMSAACLSDTSPSTSSPLVLFLLKENRFFSQASDGSEDVFASWTRPKTDCCILDCWRAWVGWMEWMLITLNTQRVFHPCVCTCVSWVHLASQIPYSGVHTRTVSCLSSFLLLC